MDIVNIVNELLIQVNKLDRLTRLKDDVETDKAIGAYFEVDGMAMQRDVCTYDGENISFEKDLFVDYLKAEIKLSKIRINATIDIIKEMRYNEFSSGGD